MKCELGKEMEYVRRRLQDIQFLAKNTEPADTSDWEFYAKGLRDIIAKHAADAEAMLDIHHALQRG